MTEIQGQEFDKPEDFHEEGPFETFRENHELSRIGKIGLGLGIVGAAAGAAVGLSNDTLNSLRSPDRLNQLVGDYSPIVNDTLKAVDNGMAISSPYVMAALTGAVLTTTFSKFLSAKLNAHKNIALSDPSSTGLMVTEGVRFKQLAQKYVLAPFSLAGALTVGLTGNAYAMREGLTENPQSAVEAVFETTKGDEDLATEQFLVLQTDDISFQEESILNGSQVSRLMSALREDGGTSTPFQRILGSIDHNLNPTQVEQVINGEDIAQIEAKKTTGMMLGFPLLDIREDAFDETKLEAFSDELLHPEHENFIPALVDDGGSGFGQGDIITFQNSPVSVEAELEGLAFLNRAVLFTDLETMQNALTGETGEDSQYYGVIVDGINREDVERLLTELNISAAVIDQSEFEENNQRIWEDNVSKLLLLMAAQIGGQGAAAIFGKRAADRERNIRNLIRESENGLTDQSFRGMNYIRGLHASAVSAAAGSVIMIPLGSLMTLSTAGFNVEPDVKAMAVGATWGTFSQMAGSAIGTGVSERSRKLRETNKV